MHKPRRPYANRTNVCRSVREYPSSYRGVNSVSYSPLNDPHLEHFFRRKLESATGRLSSCSTPRSSTRSSLSPPPGANVRTPSSCFLLSQTSTVKKKKEKNNDELAYKVTVRTGEDKDAGTGTQIYVTIFGTRCKWSKKCLTSKQHEVFPPGSVRSFHLKGPDLGDVEKVCIEHNSVKKSDSWYLQHLVVSNVETGQRWKCSCQQWLSLYHTDCQTSRTLSARQIVSDSKTSDISSSSEMYNETLTVTVVTGDTRGAGTDANVFLTLHGSKGSTAPVHLKDSDGFERGSTRTFLINTPVELGEVSHLYVEHDNTGFAPAWFLEHITVQQNQSTVYFSCGLWLALDIGDRCLGRTLYPTPDRPSTSRDYRYRIVVETGDVRGAGTDANVFVTLSGSKDNMAERKLESHPENFERGRRDEFTVKTDSLLGTIEKVHVSHDNTGPSPAWYIEKVTVIDPQGQEYVFVCKQWLGRGFQNGCSIVLTREKGGHGEILNRISERSYTLAITTDDEPRSGTTADVYVVLHGDEYSSDEMWLKGASNGVFSRGMVDSFTVTVPKKVHPLKRLTVGHNSKGASSDWLLKQVKVTCMQHDTVQIFPCGKWITGGQSGRKMEKVLHELSSKDSSSVYRVSLKTGDEREAGTNAVIHAEVVGSEGSTGKVYLPDEEEFFERGLTDSFQYTWPYLGEIEKIVIGHDGAGEYPNWLLEEVNITCCPTGQMWSFSCKQWLKAHHDITLACTHCNPANKPLGDICQNKCLCESDGEDDSSDGKDDEHGSGNDTEEISHREQNASYEDDFSGDSSTEQSSSVEEEDEDIEGSEDDEQEQSESIPYTVHMVLDPCDPGKYSLEVRLVGSAARSPLLTLTYRMGTPGTKQRTETFSVDTINVGKLQCVEVSNKSSKRCNLVQLTVTSPTTGQSTNFLCSEQLEARTSASLTPTVESLDNSVSSAGQSLTEQTLQAYELKVYTSDKKYASTTNCLQLQLMGVEGSSKIFTIRNSSSKGLFQRGQIDSVQVASLPLGPLKVVKLTHAPVKRNTGIPADDMKWHLYQIIVRDVLTKKSYYFPCKAWISTGVFVELALSKVEP